MLKSSLGLGLGLGAIAIVGAASLLGACSAGDTASTGEFNGEGGSQGHGAGHGSSTGSNTTTISGQPDTGSLNPSTSATGGGGGDQCGGTAKTAEPVPLDLFVMLDQSGSMADTTTAGATKWDAVTGALKNFFSDPASAGLNVGMQFFPLLAAGVPATCSSSAQCNGHGPCALKVCNTSNPSYCDTAADCGGASCVKVGECNSGGCYPAGGQCADGSTCVAITSSVCLTGDSCSAADYGTPEAAIATLDAGQISALDAAMAAHGPTGATPTSAALHGAVNYSKGYATSKPNDAVAVVFVTDGLPTECTPTGIPAIAGIAADGLSGSPSVKTFVIGVFSQTDIASGAQSNLNQIAQAGSGNDAFIVDTSGNVAQQFQAALDAIRGSHLQCTYQVPAPDAGEEQDFGKVNVEYTAPGSSTPETVPYVATAAGCDPASGGWYYDVDPAGGGTPMQILMCPATCTEFGSGGAVNIRVGCKTVGPH